MSTSPGRALRRQHAAMERESRALSLLVAGKSNGQIAADIGVALSSVPAILRRGLERRAAEEGPTVEEARVLYLARLYRLLDAWMPLATGTFRADPDDDVTPPALPDVRAGELALKLITQIASVESKQLGEAVREGDRIDVYHHVEQGQDLVGAIMAQLAETRQHGQIVDGQLADADTSLAERTGLVEIDSAPAAPADWQPPGEEDDDGTD